MLASISGLSEIVRVLLDAGADVKIKDRLGLTAMDWSNRRGFPEVAEMLANSAKVPTHSPLVGQKLPLVSEPASHAVPNITPATSEVPEDAASREAGNGEAETPRLDQVARLQALFDQLSAEQKISWPASQEDEPLNRQAVARQSSEEQDAINLERELDSAEAERAANDLAWEKSRLETERLAAETRRRVEEEVLRKSLREEQEAIKVEEERRKVEEERAANEMARERSRLETERIAEESRKKVEEAVRKTRLGETRVITQDIWPVQTVSSLTLSAATTEPEAATPLKRCPKCDATFKGEFCTNCATEDLTLISAVSPYLSESNADILARPMVWMLMAITLAGGVFLGYQLNDYVSKREKRTPTTTAAAPVQQPASVKPPVPETSNSPVVGGELSGAEASIPEPEYPSRAKNEGVSGTITVRVRVNNEGRVILARSSTGDWRLRAAAVQAAKKATFLPEKLAADERFVSGTITYTFKP
jgi:TonB family protein